MTKPVTGLVLFGSSAGPDHTTDLDGNYSALQNAINDFLTYSNYLLDTSGAANTITAAIPASTTFALNAGIKAQVKVANTNTSGVVNVNINGTGNVRLVHADGSNPGVGEITAGMVVDFIYESVSGQYQIQSMTRPSGTGLFPDGTAGAPSISFASDTTLGLFKAGADVLGVATSGISRATFPSTGGLSLLAPTSGPVLTATTLETPIGFILQGPNTGAGWNLEFFDTTNSLARGFIGIGTNAITGMPITDLGITSKAGSVQIGRANGSALATSFGPNGNVSIAAPSAGIAFTVNAFAGTRPASFVSPNTASQSFGPLITAGTNANDNALTINNAAASQTYLSIRGDGILQLQAGVQPAFSTERITSNQNITASAVTDLIFNGTNTIQGSGYSTGTGVFTAPVAGLYFFMCSINMTPAGTNCVVNGIFFSKNNATSGAGQRFDIGIGTIGAQYSNTGNSLWFAGCAWISLAANDTVRIKWDAGTSGAGTNQLGTSSKFQGYLLG